MFKPEDFEIIDAHIHPFEDPSQRIGAYSCEQTMAEFDAENRAFRVEYDGEFAFLHAHDTPEVSG